MGLSKKRKLQLAQITARAAESKKARKTDQENQRKKRFLRKQREEEDFWDEHEDLRSESSFDGSSSDKSSSDKSSSDKSSLCGRGSDEGNSDGNHGRGDNTKEGLGNNDGGVQLEVEDHSFKPIWKDDAGGYLRGVRGCGSLTTEKRERKRKKEREKSASTTRPIVDMFSAQSSKNRSSDKDLLPTPTPTVSPQALKKKVKEARHEVQTRAVQDLGELLRTDGSIRARIRL